MALRRRDSSQPRSPADRCVAVAARFAIYRQFGRRPSQVYVDNTMQSVASGSPEGRLSDNVFWQTSAEVGDQIEDRAGGMLLRTEAEACHPVQLSAPRPLEVATAFGHADAVLREDRKILDGLLANGMVIEVSAHRSSATPSRLPDILLAEDHPLVVTIRPRNLDGVRPALPAVRGNNTATNQNSPAPH
jgi:hypothetical protein